MGSSYPWKTRPVEPAFRNRNFEVKFWQESGDEQMRGFEALEKFGAPVESDKITPETFARPRHTYPIRSAPPGIDVLTPPSGIAFDQAWRDRVEGSIFGVRFHFTSLPQPVATAPAIGRSRDVEQWKRSRGKAESGPQAFL